MSSRPLVQTPSSSGNLGWERPAPHAHWPVALSKYLPSLYLHFFIHKAELNFAPTSPLCGAAHCKGAGERMPLRTTSAPRCPGHGAPRFTCISNAHQPLHLSGEGPRVHAHLSASPSHSGEPELELKPV